MHCFRWNTLDELSDEVNVFQKGENEQRAGSFVGFGQGQTNPRLPRQQADSPPAFSLELVLPSARIFIDISRKGMKKSREKRHTEPGKSDKKKIGSSFAYFR